MIKHTCEFYGCFTETEAILLTICLEGDMYEDHYCQRHIWAALESWKNKNRPMACDHRQGDLIYKYFTGNTIFNCRGRSIEDEPTPVPL